MEVPSEGVDEAQKARGDLEGACRSLRMIWNDLASDEVEEIQLWELLLMDESTKVIWRKIYRVAERGSKACSQAKTSFARDIRKCSRTSNRRSATPLI